MTFLPGMLQMQEREVDPMPPALYSVCLPCGPLLTHEHTLIIKMGSKASAQAVGGPMLQHSSKARVLPLHQRLSRHLVYFPPASVYV